MATFPFYYGSDDVNNIYCYTQSRTKINREFDSRSLYCTDITALELCIDISSGLYTCAICKWVHVLTQYANLETRPLPTIQQSADVL